MSNELQTTDKPQPKPLQLVKDGLMAMDDQLTSVLPSHVTKERFAQVVCTAVASSDQLAEVALTAGGRRSIFTASVQCASDGLIPDNREAALVSFNKKVGDNRWEKHAQYMPMVRGIVNRIQQAGDAKEIGVELVYQNEVREKRFHYRRTQNGVDFFHDPDPFDMNKGEPVGVYASMNTKDGGFYVAVLSKADVAKIKASSKGRNTPWNGPFEHEMWKKSAIKRLAKIAPVSAEIRKMLDQDNEKFHTLEHEPAKPTLMSRLQEQATAIEGEVIDGDEPGETADDKAVSHIEDELNELAERAVEDIEDGIDDAVEESQADLLGDEPTTDANGAKLKKAAPSGQSSAAKAVEEAEDAATSPTVKQPPAKLIETGQGAEAWAESFSVWYKSLTRAERKSIGGTFDKLADKASKITDRAQEIITDANNSPAADEEV